MTDQTIIEQELLRCPFCGHLPFHRQLVNDGRWETSCQTATCIRPGTGIRRTETEAIAAWNTRAQSSAVLPSEAMVPGGLGKDGTWGTAANPAPAATPTAPVQDDDAEWLRLHNMTYGFPAATAARLERIASRLSPTPETDQQQQGASLRDRAG
jgi:hypothetical protein